MSDKIKINTKKQEQVTTFVGLSDREKKVFSALQGTNFIAVQFDDEKIPSGLVCHGINNSQFAVAAAILLHRFNEEVDNFQRQNEII